MTPDELAGAAAAAADQLVKGEHSALLFIGTWGPAYAVAVMGAAAAGRPIVPLNYRLGADQLKELLLQHPSALVISDDPDRIPAGTVGAIQQTETWISSLEGGPEWASGGSQPGDAAALLYTSGTTSKPKAAILRHEHLVSYVMSTVEFGHASLHEANLISVPPYHIAGLANLLSNLFAGRRMVALPTPDPAEWIATVARERITHAFVVPTLLRRIVDHAQTEQVVLPSLRHVAYGGARTPTSTIRDAIEVFPEADLVQAYGLTETSSTISVLDADDHRAALDGDADAIRRLSSVGRPLPTVEVQIRDDDGGQVDGFGSGRIWVRGDQISGEYVGLAAATDDHGWLDTRDRGHLDAAGYLFVEGREDDTIIRGGENIAPAEIEDVLLEHPNVIDATVAGVPDHEWGQVPAAAVVVDGDVLEAELQSWTRERLRTSKTPAIIEFWSELPLTDTGKVVRRDVVPRLTEAKDERDRDEASDAS